MRFHLRRLVLLAAAVAAIGGCRTFSPTPMDQVGFKERAETQTKDDVTAKVVVLTAEEARAVFDTKLYKKKIQPVWLEITNGTDDEMLFLPRSIDPDYFSPLEVAQKTHWRWSKQANLEKKHFNFEHQMPFVIPHGETVSGFVFTNRSKGVRWVLVEVFTEHKAVHVEFINEVPGFKADFHKLEEGDLYEAFFPGQEIVDFTEPEDLRKWVEAQPATVTNADGSKTGDPLNLVIIGGSEAVWPAFLRSGWDPTAAMGAGTALKTGFFGIFGGAYRYAPISNLYVYGRSQDLALQKVRSNIHYRNHLRLWLAPVTMTGLPVMIGQISRDIGSRFTTKSKTLTTHRIDPNVDDTRAALVQDFIYAQALKAYAMVGGVGFVSPDEPRGNLTGDPWFTDGNRAVMLLTGTPTSVIEIEWFDWTEDGTD
ncbi:MAG: LssY C-terminal domain-containing protein [Thermoanaerobaculales bacterium]